MKPKLAVRILSPFPPHEEPKEIRVHLPRKATKREEARAFFVGVSNIKGKTAEGVRPFLLVSGMVGMAPLVMVQPQGAPWMDFTWTRTRMEFDQNPHPLASALIYESASEEFVTLNPKGSGRAFILFFTIRGENLVFFPTKTRMTARIPSRFEIVLLFEMKDWGIYESKRLRVDVQSWNSLHIWEIKPKSRLHFFRKSPK